ncbi:MAG: DNA polymerase [Spirochaetia bacterium]|nr:DNA polymerase [Spirochaetia bacterium]
MNARLGPGIENQTFTGTLFDVYNLEDEIHVWMLGPEGPRHFLDHYRPVIFADGPLPIIQRLVGRLRELGAIYGKPVWTIRTHFYLNEPRRVLKIQIARPSLLGRITRKLYAFYGKLDLYHSDIEIPTGYMFEKNIFPLCKLDLQYKSTPRGNFIQSFTPLTKIVDLEYEIPDFTKLGMRLAKSPRLGLAGNPLIFELPDGKEIQLNSSSELNFLNEINSILARVDPDIILSSFGDQIIFPELFTMAQKYNLPLLFDRHGHHSLRQIIRKGRSFNTYGSWIFRAPSYPLFGRLHVDAQNSFVFKEAQLTGILELARLARTPIQRMARQSTGGALTSIETGVAIRKHYLVPWQKSAVEQPRTAYDLLMADKGGLIFVPDSTRVNVFENVAQMDFSQMYPTIMVHHNISPECVNCPCCASDPSAPRVPESSVHICIKRRGVVSDALAHILKRRKHYKEQIAKLKQSKHEATSKPLLENYDTRQNSLKWMLVTSFGYLGFRNAKFGRLESHESVTAFGREKLLIAKELAEEQGYSLSHAITDCIFLNRKGAALDPDDLSRLADRISQVTNVEMSMDGVYSWIIFLPSRQDDLLPVMNRYCGRFTNGTIKYRGVAARRKDTASFHREAQLAVLSVMAKASSIQELRLLHGEVDQIIRKYESNLINREVPWQDLILRKTASRELAQYKVQNATYLAMKQLETLSLEVQAGEKVRYVVLNSRHHDKTRRVISEETASQTDRDIHYDVAYYLKLLREGFQEIWGFFAPPGYFNYDPQLPLFKANFYDKAR